LGVQHPEADTVFIRDDLITRLLQLKTDQPFVAHTVAPFVLDVTRNRFPLDAAAVCLRLGKQDGRDVIGMRVLTVQGFLDAAVLTEHDPQDRASLTLLDGVSPDCDMSHYVRSFLGPQGPLDTQAIT